MVQDPVQFARCILKLSLTAKQKEILRSVAKNPRTAVKACHASGKTFIAAVLVLWFLVRYPDAIVVTTAPTWMQVRRVLWGEIRRLIYNSPFPFPEPLETSLRLGPGRYAIGLSTNEGVRLQGFHSKHMLIVLDEAPGVLPGIYEAIEGIRAGGDVKILALGNPVIASGPFYDAFTANRESWSVISISAFDTPNLEGLTPESLRTLSAEELADNPTPYLTTRGWVKEKLEEWGLDHQLWEARVMGNFPMQSDSALISLTWLETAKDTEGGKDGRFYAGVDVGGPGESETVLCVRDGERIVLLKAWRKDDPRGSVIAELARYKDYLQTVNVDSVGIGDGMVKHLDDQGFPVRAINVGERSYEPEKYVNLKAEYYWSLRMRAEVGNLLGLTDDRTIGQLAGIQYSQNGRGQIVIESKADALKRGVKSPDRAEAVMLAYAQVQYSEYRIRVPRAR